MKVNQISIFLENKAGRLCEVTRILGVNNVNIRALTLADTADFGILRLIVNDTDKANRLLKDNGFTVAITEVIAVEVEDRPGGLSKILDILSKAGINVEYMYAFVERSQDNAVLIFRFDDQYIDKAISVLQSASVRVLEGEKVSSL